MQNTSSFTIVLTGGGTGGHIYPNLALAEEFAARGFKCVYLGGEGDTLERRLANASGLEYYGVPSIKLVRSISPSAVKNNLAIPLVLSRAVKSATGTLERISPSAVFSKGGFVSLPAVLAANKLSVPVFAHESDLTLGIANRIAKLKGATILKANPHAKFGGELVGMPMRRSLFAATRASAADKLNVHTSRPILLITGGSSGAKYINEAVAEKIESLTERYFVLHIVGKAGAPAVKAAANYKSIAYADDMASCYALADVVLSRAGATAVYELAALKKRAVFVPLPKGISRGDQLDNAALAQEYGGHVVYQNDSFSDNLLPAIENALHDPPMKNIFTDSNGKIADLLCASLRRGEKCTDKKP